MGKVSAPVSIDDSLYDQASRYGLSIEDYLRGTTTTSYTPGSDIPATAGKGNPFFTGINQPVRAKKTTTTNNTPRPFIWQGNNKSLRASYQNSYDAFWNSRPTVTNSDIEQHATWKGPQIRPEYGESSYSNGLSYLGTAKYWQDNNNNDLYDFDFDDKFTANPNQPISPPTTVTTPSAPQWAMPQEQVPQAPIPQAPIQPPRVPQIGDEDYQYQWGDIDYNPRGQIRDEYGYQIAGPYFNSDGMYMGEWEEQHWT